MQLAEGQSQRNGARQPHGWIWVRPAFALLPWTTVQAATPINSTTPLSSGSLCAHLLLISAQFPRAARRELPGGRRHWDYADMRKLRNKRRSGAREKL